MGSSVVVPLDGSVESERALLYAVPIARAEKTTLHLVGVTRPGIDRRRFPLLPDADDGDHPPLHPRGHSYLDAVADRVRNEFSDENVVTALLEGPAAKAVAMYERRTHARAVVMTRPEVNGFADEAAGIVAVRVSRLAGVPVILIRPDHSQSGRPAINWRCQRIAVALDGSTEAESVLEFVRAFGLAIDAQVTLVRVVNPATTVGSGYPPVARTGALEALHPATRVAEAQLGRIADGLRNQGLRVATRVLYGAWPQAEAINRVARDLDADLIAIAARSRPGRGAVECVACSLLRSACAPVLVFSSAMIPKVRLPQEPVDANPTAWLAADRRRWCEK